MIRLAAALLLLISLPAAAEPTHDELIALINQARADYGLGAVRGNANLGVAARGHAADMATNDFLSHTGSDGRKLVERVAASGYAYAYVSEAVAGGARSPREALHMWLTSANHRDLVLSPEAREVGIGIAHSPHSTYKTYWAAVFGRRFGE